MVGQIWYGNTPTQPDWLKSFGGRDTMALFPARIDPALFTDDLATVIATTAGSAAGIDEVQSLTIDATGGTFTLTDGGSVAVPVVLAWNVTLVNLQTALNTIYGAGNAQASGANGGPFTVVFTGALADTNVAAMITNAASLTGSGHTATVATVVGGVAAGTTLAVTVTAPPQLGRYVSTNANRIPSNTSLDFGNGRFAKLTQDLLLSDTTAHVAGIGSAIPLGAKAYYSPYYRKTILAGRLVSRSYADAAAGNPFVPAITNGVFTANDETFLTYFTIDDAYQNADVELVAVGREVTIAINYLPDYATLDSTAIAWLRANYNCIIAQGG